MAWSARFEGYNDSTGDASKQARFRFYRSGEAHTVFGVARSRTLETVLGIDGDAAQAATLRWAVRRMGQLVEGNAVRSEYTIDVDAVVLRSDDAAELRRLVGPKECRYQTRVSLDSDLYCAAAAKSDETAVGSDGLRILAPTSVPLCESCELPSTDVVCSHLSHPEVFGIAAMGGLVSRDVAGAMCELGNPEVQRCSECRPGGYDCWERVFETQTKPLAEVPPLALHEAFDFLDAVWRLRFDAALIRRVPMVTLASLGESVGDRDDFKARMSELADVLAALDPGAVLPTEAHGVRGSLARIAAALDAEGINDAREPVERLRSVVAIRTALQHADRSSELATRLEDLGVRVSPIDWTQAWRAVCSITVDALRDLRSLVRESDEL